MDSSSQQQNSSTQSESQNIPTVPHLHFGKLPLVFFILSLLTVALGGYILGVNQTGTSHSNSVSPTVPFATNIPTSVTSNQCTSDKECPVGYACQAQAGEGQAQVMVPGKTNTSPSIKPPFKITQGVCKLQAGGTCSSDDTCMTGLICQKGPNGANTCQNQINGTCSGPNDASCGPGYTCVVDCGPPILPVSPPPPTYSCIANEVATKPRMCPVCLASNTKISTPQGTITVTKLQTGMEVWSVDTNGKKIKSKIIKTGNMEVLTTHHVVHIVLSDGRQLWVSPNHPTATGIKVGDIHSGNTYDNALVTSAELVAYWDTKTYDILPDSETGFYFANGILMGSTLKE